MRFFTILILIGLSKITFSCDDLFKVGSCTDVEKSSIQVLKKCANSGDIESQLQLANIYWHGLAHISVNKEKSFKWSLMAAKKGCAKSQLYVGESYYYGEGIEPSISKAIHWWERSAISGNPEAACNLGYSKYNGDTGEAQSDSLNKDIFNLFSASLKGGSNKCSSYLATLYFNGIGVKKNLEKSKKILEDAISENNSYSGIAEKTYADLFGN